MAPNNEFAHQGSFENVISNEEEQHQQLKKRKTEIKYVPGKGDKRFEIDPNSRRHVNWLHVVILFGVPIFALYGVATTPLQSKTLILAAITYFLTGFGITGGYHRLWSHKAWSAVAPVRFLVLMFGAAAMQGSARWWCRNHRAHHKFTDTSKDPYNVRKGFFYAHFGWMLWKQNPKEVGRADIDDLNRDPMIMFQHQYYGYIAIFTSIILPTLIAGFGWGDFRGGYFYASLTRIFFVHHATFFVNSLAHYLGDQAYSDLHTAFDSVVTALLTLGEGYHNYHHEFPQDYRNGIRWFQYDPTKWTILVLYHLGLAYDLKWIPENEINKAKLQVQAGLLAAKKNRIQFGPNLDKNLPVFTLEQLTQAAENNKVMFAIEGRVYDCTEFLDFHPGGRETMIKYNGKEVTGVFNGETGDNIHSKHAREMLVRYIVGKLAN